MEYKITFSEKSKYISKKYLLEFAGTVSLTKIEEIISGKDFNPRIISVAAVYAYINNKTNLSKFKHKRLFEEVNNINNEISKLNLVSDEDFMIDQDTFNNFYKKAIASKFHSTNIKVFKNISVIRNEEETTVKLKEAFRKNLEEYIKKENISFNTFSKYVAESKVDSGNLHKFVKGKEYDKLSIEKIIYLRGRLNEVV